VLNISRTKGYVHFEGQAHRLISECLPTEDPLAAEEHAENALNILGYIGARNDFAKALVTRAKLRRANGEIAAADQLLSQALSIFESLGTQDEPIKLKALLGGPDRLSSDSSGQHASTRLLRAHRDHP
jgi:hypothetical protein